MSNKELYIQRTNQMINAIALLPDFYKTRLSFTVSISGIETKNQLNDIQSALTVELKSNGDGCFSNLHNCSIRNEPNCFVHVDFLDEKQKQRNEATKLIMDLIDSGVTIDEIRTRINADGLVGNSASITQ